MQDSECLRALLPRRDPSTLILLAVGGVAYISSDDDADDDDVAYTIYNQPSRYFQATTSPRRRELKEVALAQRKRVKKGAYRG